MFVRVPRMKLQDYFSVPHNLFVFGSAVTALAIEQPLVPAAAPFNISHSNERLSLHETLPFSIATNSRNFFSASARSAGCSLAKPPAARTFSNMRSFSEPTPARLSSSSAQCSCASALSASATSQPHPQPICPSGGGTTLTSPAMVLRPVSSAAHSRDRPRTLNQTSAAASALHRQRRTGGTPDRTLRPIERAPTRRTTKPGQG